MLVVEVSKVSLTLVPLLAVNPAPFTTRSLIIITLSPACKIMPLPSLVSTVISSSILTISATAYSWDHPLNTSYPIDPEPKAQQIRGLTVATPSLVTQSRDSTYVAIICIFSSICFKRVGCQVVLFGTKFALTPLLLNRIY